MLVKALRSAYTLNVFQPFLRFYLVESKQAMDNLYNCLFQPFLRFYDVV